MKNVLSLYKEIGETPLMRLNRFKQENPEYDNISMTYAGRLDPMAEGLLLVLAGDEVYKKDEYNKLDKEYEFEVLFGLSTDTLDVLGIINCEKKELAPELSFELVQELIPELLGKQIQKYPTYSSKTINGTPLWKLAREESLSDVTIPEHEIEIYSLDMVSVNHISSKELLGKVIKNISKVKGDFRQDKTVKIWTKTLKEDESFTVLKLKAQVSSGTYIRELASVIGKKLNTCALALSIKRVSIGDFNIEERPQDF